MLRDIYFYLISLVFVVYICWDYHVTIMEASILILLYPFYLYTSYYFSNKENEFEKNEVSSMIKESLPWKKYYGDLDSRCNMFVNPHKLEFENGHQTKGKRS